MIWQILLLVFCVAVGIGIYRLMDHLDVVVVPCG